MESVYGLRKTEVGKGIGTGKRIKQANRGKFFDF
jgi:hypothetical protein